MEDIKKKKKKKKCLLRGMNWVWNTRYFVSSVRSKYAM